MRIPHRRTRSSVAFSLQAPPCTINLVNATKSVLMDSLRMPDNKKNSPFAEYRPFISELKRLAHHTALDEEWNPRVAAALDGQASQELRRVVPLDARRKAGAFFTGTALSARLI